jgi:hypothetical protein
MPWRKSSLVAWQASRRFDLVSDFMDDLDTPCLVLERGRVAANAARLRRHVEGLGSRLRVHVKTVPLERFTRRVAGYQLARLLCEVDQNRGRLRQHDSVIIDRRDLLEWAQLAVGIRAQFVGRVIHAYELERHLHLFERPQDPQVPRATELTRENP